MDDRAIFIGGLSHSGKTEVRRVLGAHPAVHLTRRTSLWTRHYGRFGDLARPRALERCLAVLLADPDVRHLAPDVEKLRRAFAEGPATYARLFGLIHAQHAERLGKTRWGLQLGLLERVAPAILSDFPDARMVHMIRDPRDLTVSRRNFTRGRAAVALLTARWRESVTLALSTRRRFGDRYRIVRFEDLVANPATTLAELCDFVQLPLSPGHPSTSAMSAALVEVAGALERRSARAGLREPEAAFVTRHARGQLADMGYPAPAAAGRARPLGIRVLDRPVLRVAQLAARSAGAVPPQTGGRA